MDPELELESDPEPRDVQGVRDCGRLGPRSDWWPRPKSGQPLPSGEGMNFERKCILDCIVHSL